MICGPSKDRAALMMSPLFQSFQKATTYCATILNDYICYEIRKATVKRYLEVEQKRLMGVIT